ncbi:glycerophosphodiester phosphodiesterase family protein [Aureliella helgolandensis]|uniref:Putative glycerophosphoryl diester phosphodiesterase 1 n=1 Tax=Aureliella helgolandensis TaxID=2527968 RepID=A0A518G7A2_9BACT|nr:glycerophosphodiester phosphodiesterase family protein [Aureliella helgolandensis]QDV24463.1 putative glycerophosphoryl diester phosphodiesterase 1 [Aureliella helgolandensis]
MKANFTKFRHRSGHPAIQPRRKAVVRIAIAFLAVSQLLLALPPTTLAQSSATDFFAIKSNSSQELQELLAYTGQRLPVVSAHRGGPTVGYPENCIATFEHTLSGTFSLLEIDPRLTADGEIVLLHDSTLDRTTTGHGPVSNFTLAQLRSLRLKDPENNLTEFPIPTLDEVLEWARGRTVIILDQKDVPIEASIRKIEEHHAEGYAMLIVSRLADAQRVHQLNSKILMEVMIPTHAKLEQFRKSGIPWGNLVAFIGHTPPQDAALIRAINSAGVMCIAGTSRNLDRELLDAGSRTELKLQYQQMLEFGVDLLETDLPLDVATLVYPGTPIPDRCSGILVVEKR